jgi:hypothetical protein
LSGDCVPSVPVCLCALWPRGVIVRSTNTEQQGHFIHVFHLTAWCGGGVRVACEVTNAAQARGGE